MRLKLNKDQKRLPVGGHHVKIDGVMFKEETFSGLVKKVTDFRLSNGMTVGEPEQEILLFYAKHWPFMVKDDRESHDPVINTEYACWRDWVVRLWKNPPKKCITVKEAKDRWAICIGCPHNKEFSWKESDESAQVSRRTFMLRRGIDVPEDLGFCALHKADLSVFTFIDTPLPFSAKKDCNKCERCWVK